MKKIFSLFAAVLFVGSMMAGEVTITPSDFTAVENSDYSTTKDGVTVAVTASTVTAEQLRIFKGKTITISAESNITKIEFTCTANGTAKYGPGCFAAQNGYTFEESGKTGTWTGSAKSVTFTAEANQVRATQIVVTVEGGAPVEPKEEFYLTGSFRSWAATADANYKFAATATEGEYALKATFDAAVECKAIGLKEGEDTKWYPDGMENNFALEAGEYTIYLRPAGNAGEGWHEGVLKAEKKEPFADPTNCAEAAAAALSVENNNDLYNDGKEYTIEGFVTSIQSAYNSQYNNVSFWMADTKEGGNVLEAYRAACNTAADAPNVGDKVAVTGKLTKYGTTPEFAAGCTYTILERAEVIPAENLGEKTIAEFLELKNTKDTCILTGVVKNIVNTTYGNFDLKDETGTVYVYGLLTAEGEAKKFEELGIEENDTLTIKAVYNEYQGTPQAKNAVFVSVTKGEGGGEDENHPYDEDADFDVTFASYSIDDSDLADYGNLYIEASDEEGNYIILDITLPEGATGLVAGIYPVDDTYEYPAQTVTAGIYEEEVFYPSFAATLVEQEGQMYLDKIWWIVSGQVEVDEDLNITVDALNSLGKEIVAVLSGNPQTAVETTKVADRAVKFIENAMLLIERNGVRYNVMGQVVR